MCERMAAFGIGLNLVTYLVSNLHLPVAFSANIVTNYLGTAYMVCLLGGYIADTWIGRFRTILLGAVLQFLVFNFTPHLKKLIPSSSSNAISCMWLRDINWFHSRILGLQIFRHKFYIQLMSNCTFNAAPWSCKMLMSDHVHACREWSVFKKPDSYALRTDFNFELPWHILKTHIVHSFCYA